MPSPTDDLPLAREFPEASHDDWKKLVDGVLKGAPFDKLVSRTYDGLRLEPVYPRAKGAAPIGGRTAGSPWQIVQRIDHPDAAAANAQALKDLENGATGLALVFAGAPGAHGFGLPATGLAQVLDGIHLDAGIGLDLEEGEHAPAGIGLERLDPGDLHVSSAAYGRVTIRGGFQAWVGGGGKVGLGVPGALGEGMPHRHSIRHGVTRCSHGVSRRCIFESLSCSVKLRANIV